MWNIARLWTCTASTRQDRNLVALLECGELCHALCVHLHCRSKIEGWTVGYRYWIAFNYWEIFRWELSPARFVQFWQSIMTIVFLCVVNWTTWYIPTSSGPWPCQISWTVGDSKQAEPHSLARNLILHTLWKGTHSEISATFPHVFMCIKHKIKIKFHAQKIKLLLTGKFSGYSYLWISLLPPCLHQTKSSRTKSIQHISLYNEARQQATHVYQTGKVSCKSIENEERQSHMFSCSYFSFLSLPIQLHNSHNKIIKSSAYVMRFRACEKRDVQVLVSSSASPRWMSITRPKAVAKMVSKVNNW